MLGFLTRRSSPTSKATWQLLVWLGLLACCRSEQVAFRFQPALPVQTQLSTPALPALQAASLQTTVLPRTAAPAPKSNKKIVRLPLTARSRLAAAHRFQSTPTALARPFVAVRSFARNARGLRHTPHDISTNSLERLVNWILGTALVFLLVGTIGLLSTSSTLGFIVFGTMVGLALLPIAVVVVWAAR